MRLDPLEFGEGVDPPSFRSFLGVTIKFANFGQRTGWQGRPLPFRPASGPKIGDFTATCMMGCNILIPLWYNPRWSWAAGGGGESRCEFRNRNSNWSHFRDLTVLQRACRMIWFLFYWGWTKPSEASTTGVGAVQIFLGVVASIFYSSLSCKNYAKRNEKMNLKHRAYQ